MTSAELSNLFRISHYAITVNLEGFTHEEIGEVLGIPSGTSKARLFRARAALREELAAFAGDWAR